MSKMSDLDLEVREMIEQGYRPSTISALLGIPVTWVYEVAEDEEKSNTEVFNPYNTVNS